MEMLILSVVIAAVVQKAAVDTVAMATGKTPPSHAYRMARLKEQAARERRQAADPDTRGGIGQVVRHWYLDACEDVDHWRAHRHATKPERKAARERRRAERARLIREWAERTIPDEDEVVDAEVVNEKDATEGAIPDPPTPPPPGSKRTRTTTTTTSSTVTEEQETSTPGSEVSLLAPEAQAGERPPLPYRRLVLMSMLASAGYAANTDAIADMGSEEVDAAITALLAHERATRAATH